MKDLTKIKYSPTDLSNMLDNVVTRQTIIRWINDGKLKAARVGNCFKISSSVASDLVKKAKKGLPIP